MRISTLCLITAVFVVPLISFASSNSRVDYVKQQLVSSGFDVSTVNALFGNKKIVVYPYRAISYKQPNWVVVKKKLFNQTLIQAGLAYIASNQSIFNKAEKDFGVPRGVIVGIIAIETDFGKNSGDYVTFNTLYSRMKQWPAMQWKSQANELIGLSKYCLGSHIDCFSIKGSYAGAFGLVQFMPSSLLAYGVDGNQDGVIDLSQPADAIPSAANFIKNHGWEQNQLLALTHYYGSSVGYPQIVLTYASLLGN